LDAGKTVIVKDHSIITSTNMGRAEDKQRLEEAKLLTRRKCKRCHNYYTLQEIADDPAKGKCYYHPGEYVEPVSAVQGTRVGWSCCVRGAELGLWGLHLVNDPALDKSCKGCQEADQHEEDWEYTNNILCFPIDVEAAKQANNETQQATATPTPTEKLTKDVRKDNFIVHPLNRLDTLMGLALRYDVPIDELKRVNQLTGHNISHLFEILIPLKPNQTPEVKKIHLTKKQEQDQLIRSFRSKTGVDLDEAKFYMEEANFDLDAALSEYKADSQWEASKGKKQAVY